MDFALERNIAYLPVLKNIVQELRRWCLSSRKRRL